MKLLPSLLLCLATACVTLPGFAQPADKTTATPAPVAPAPQLTYFDLDFPGGTPRQLVAMIQNAMHRPVNIIISDENAEWKLPPLKMNHVTVPQLFHAFDLSSHLNTTVETGYGNFQQNSVVVGFRTRNTSAADSDDTIWYFFVDSTASLPTVSRFYHLGRYLDRGLTVDDITTAIQTGWKLRGEANPPKLSFHKETKLLIAVGNFAALGVINAVLKALDSAVPQVVTEKPADAPKTKS